MHTLLPVPTADAPLARESGVVRDLPIGQGEHRAADGLLEVGVSDVAAYALGVAVGNLILSGGMKPLGQRKG